MSDWQIDFESLPGPDRTTLLYMHDVVRPATSRELAAVVYSVIEFRMGSYGGFFALFSGPPEAPSLLWCPDHLNCLGNLNSLQWLDNDRYVVVNAYMYDGKKRVEVPFLFVDVDTQRIAFYRVINSWNATVEVDEAGWLIREREHNKRFPSHDGERITPASLEWKPWHEFPTMKEAYWKGYTMSRREKSAHRGKQSSQHLTNRQAYNVVSDLAMGANVRVKDNVFQAIAIGVCLLLGAVIGALVTMVFRGVMYLRGRRD